MRSTTGRLAVLAAVVAAAAVLFIVLSDDEGSDTTTPTQATGGTEALTVIEVKGGQPVGGAQKIEVSKGDSVNLEVRLDEPAEEVHVHGYDIDQPAQNSPVRFSFPAKLDGVFEIELHDEGGGETQIGELTVNP